MNVKIINAASDEDEVPRYISLEEDDRVNHSRRPWWQSLEAEMLANSRRDATRGERSPFEEKLWNQIRGL